MIRSRVLQSSIVCTLALLIALASATSYGGPLVLCLSVGDHQHVLFERERHGDFCHWHGTHHEPTPASEESPAATSKHFHSPHELCHSVNTENGDLADAHQHSCIDITLFGGDLPSQSQRIASAVPDVALVAFALPAPAPASVAQAHHSAWRLPSHVPPDLLRSTILLI